MFDKKYPYSTDNVLNLDWILNKVKELDQDLTSLEERVTAVAIAESKKYLDEELTVIRSQMATLQTNFSQLVTDVNKFESDTKEYLEARLTFMNQRIDSLNDKIDASVVIVNARTDLAIQQNNDYLLGQITDKLLPSMRVVNMFTGEKMTIQNMFNYLGTLHTEDGATINYVVSADKSIDEIIAIDASCTDWVLHGRTLLA